jgi:type III restriction enzyme
LAESIVPYERKLPFNDERKPSKEPVSYLVKDGETYRRIQGRRPSKMLLVGKLRAAVDAWRASGYAGITQTTRELFTFWFEEDHVVDGEPFEYYFCQREAIETLVYLVEVKQFSDVVPVIREFSTLTQEKLVDEDFIFETPDGKRSVRRFFPERNTEGTQDLPESNLLRYAIKMATGSGKTVVMALVMVWSYFNRLRENRSNLANNFLLVAPNVIVLERLEKDFRDGRIFKELPMIPPSLSDKWNLKVISRGDTTLPGSSGTLFLQNIQQLYESRRVDKWTPENAVQRLLGRPVQNIEEGTVSVLHHVQKAPNLLVINDEAHHVHEEELAWHKTLVSIHRSVPGGLRLWLDFSATPKDQNGSYYPWIIVDYPLAEAVEDSIVKAPVILHTVKKKDPQHITQENVTKVYYPWITAALERWRYHQTYYKKLGKKPVLFIMAEKNAFADEIASLIKQQAGIKNQEVLVIHTDNKGEVKKSEIDQIRAKAREIDDPRNRIKIVVSVLMLREGWDVQNVTITLGLRPFTAKAGILPEQAVGRGLRIISGIGTDCLQTLEVIGTEEFEKFVRELEKEGVGVATFTEPPPLPVHIEPVKSKLDYDMEIPQTELLYSRNYKQLSSIDPMKLDSLKDSSILSPEKIEIKAEFGTTGTYLGTIRIDQTNIPSAPELLSHITNVVIKQANLVGSDFAEVYPIVKKYISERCFGKAVDLETERVRAKILDLDIQNAIVTILARAIGKVSAVKSPVKLKQAGLRLSKTPTFIWRRQRFVAKRTIFNYVATYNNLETNFAKFLDQAKDVTKFASLAERNVGFKIDYLSSRGAIRYYYPDFFAVQKTSNGQVNWIIETKGRRFEDTDQKEAAVRAWCKEVSRVTGEKWEYTTVPQEAFEKFEYYDFAELLKHLPHDGR